MANTLVGWRENTVVELVGRALGSTEVRVGVNGALPPGLSLTPQDRGARFSGLEDIQVGVPDLDARFQIQCENPAAAIRIMRDERTQQALRSLLEADPKASLVAGEVRLSVPRSTELELLLRRVRTAIRCSWALSEVAPPEKPRLPEGREASLQPAGGAPGAPGFKIHEFARYSPEYVQLMRVKFKQRRRLLWGLYGLTAALFALPWLGLVLAPLAPAAKLLEWGELPGYLLIGGCVVLRMFIFRCPACSTTFNDETPEFSPLRVTCENCGIELQ
jgi:hypothetical protein